MSGAAPVVVLAAALAAVALYTHRALGERSLIPLALDARVEDRRVRIEKHPGRDDRHFLVLSDRATGRHGEIEVTAEVFADVAGGEHLSKASGERTLRAGERRVPLRSHPDSRGLSVAIALTTLPALARIARTALGNRPGGPRSDRG